jgi:creatinine amidohydrolase
MLWHEQNWPTIRSLDKQMPVVVPLGSVEQHGKHMPLFVDTIQVAAVAEGVEKRLKDKILMLPTQWLGSSEHHLDFPGTISLAPNIYMQMIQSITKCILRAGFKRIFFLNGHGGNIVPASAALGELAGRDDEADAAMIALSSWWHVGKDALAPQKNGMTTPQLTHACEYETSMILYLRPDLVKMDQIRESEAVINNRWSHVEMGGKVATFQRWPRVTPSGSMGHPTAATAEKGKGMFEGVVEEVVAFLNDFARWPLLPVIGPKVD